MFDTREVDQQFHVQTMIVRDRIVQVIECHGELYLPGGRQYQQRRDAMIRSLQEREL